MSSFAMVCAFCFFAVLAISLTLIIICYFSKVKGLFYIMAILSKCSFPGFIIDTKGNKTEVTM